MTSDRSLTYQELCDRAYELSKQLQDLGASSDRLIAVMMEKGWEQVVATLAIFIDWCGLFTDRPRITPAIDKNIC
ncbi:MAG: AMP-binding protein [Hydrococcus sp. CSU_1_8]|nr:AMP-binding protein [Hydrococcus sp. CSU_1_8]